MVTALFVVDFIYFHCRKLHERSLPRFTPGFLSLIFLLPTLLNCLFPEVRLYNLPSYRSGCSYRPAVWPEYGLYRLGMYTNINAHIDTHIVSYRNRRVYMCVHVSGPWKDARGIVVCIYSSKIQFKRGLVIGANRHTK